MMKENIINFKFVFMHQLDISSNKETIAHLIKFGLKSEPEVNILRTSKINQWRLKKNVNGLFPNILVKELICIPQNIFIYIRGFVNIEDSRNLDHRQIICKILIYLYF